MAESLKLIFLSFLASIGFGLKYEMQKRYLVWAGLGGALTRLLAGLFFAGCYVRFALCGDYGYEV